MDFTFVPHLGMTIKSWKFKSLQISWSDKWVQQGALHEMLVFETCVAVAGALHCSYGLSRARPRGQPWTDHTNLEMRQ